MFIKLSAARNFCWFSCSLMTFESVNIECSSREWFLFFYSNFQSHVFFLSLSQYSGTEGNRIFFTHVTLNEGPYHLFFFFFFVALKFLWNLRQQSKFSAKFKFSARIMLFNIILLIIYAFTGFKVESLTRAEKQRQPSGYFGTAIIICSLISQLLHDIT